MLRNTSGTVKAYFYVSSTFLPLVLRINCAEVYWSRNTTSNVYTIRPYSGDDFEVYCYHNTDGGGWTSSIAQFRAHVVFPHPTETTLYKQSLSHRRVNFSAWITLESPVVIYVKLLTCVPRHLPKHVQDGKLNGSHLPAINYRVQRWIQIDWN